MSRAGSSPLAYLAAGQAALQRSPTLVLYDHCEPGRELPYDVAQVRLRGAFHPKLLLLDYGARVRVIVSSANLTREAYTTSLELFCYEDIALGVSHGWCSPLQRFLNAIRERLPHGIPATSTLLSWTSLLEGAPSGTSEEGATTLVSSFDGPLLPRVLADAGDVTDVDVVSPFFEDEGGPGVFDRLEEAFPKLRGRLFVRAQDDDGHVVIRGPEEKLTRLLSSGRWSVFRVRRQWDGDVGDPPPRHLHGKLLILRAARQATALVGSANVTRAALLSSPTTGGNAELCGLFTLSSRDADRLLPQSDEVLLAEVRVTAPDAEGEEVAVAGDWVESAVYSARSQMLRIAPKENCPPLTIGYERDELVRCVQEPVDCALLLGRELEISVSAPGLLPSLVPFAIEGIEYLIPRGVALGEISLDELLDVLAGRRELVAPDEENHVRAPGAAREITMLAGGAINWRRILRALDGLERDLVGASAFPAEVRRLLDGPLGLARLEVCLAELKGFEPADHAFLAHEARRRLQAALAEMPADAHESRSALKEHDDRLAQLFARERVAASGALRVQLEVLREELDR